MHDRTLTVHLSHFSQQNSLNRDAAAAVAAFVAASIDISELTARGGLAGISGQSVGQSNADGDVQKDLDVCADAIIQNALQSVPCSAAVSEEAAEPRIGSSSAQIAVAYDPLDGSSNIDTNMTVGTIFSVLPSRPDGAVFRQDGRQQLAAGFTIYGPQTSLVLTLGDGVNIFTLDRAERCFKLVRDNVKIPIACAEFAINASNRRHWQPPVRKFVDECLAGADGVRNKNFNMRWIASLVAEAYRILIRGGVFLYPSDARKGYENGRLRLLYEAHPIAFIMEQAGGAASDGRRPILDLRAETLHQRTPLIMGSRQDVERIDQFHSVA